MNEHIEKINEIKKVWDILPIPSIIELGLQTDRIVNEFDKKDMLVVERWLAGKKYNQIHADGYDEVECPLLYLSSSASRYYLGGLG